MAQRRTVKRADADDIDADDLDTGDAGADADTGDADTSDARTGTGSEADAAPRRRRLSAGKAGQLARRQITELIDTDPEGVSGVRPSDDGWVVTVEVVEDRRIPSSTDLLATYEVELDPDGELMSYRRLRRYARGRGDDGNS